MNVMAWVEIDGKMIRLLNYLDIGAWICAVMRMPLGYVICRGVHLANSERGAMGKGGGRLDCSLRMPSIWFRFVDHNPGCRHVRSTLHTGYAMEDKNRGEMNVAGSGTGFESMVRR